MITVDLERALWDWGNQHPEKRRYANSMRIAFQGVYAPAENGENGGNGDNNGETAPAENVPGTEFPTEPTEIIDIDEAEAPVAEFPVDGNEQGAPDAPAKSNTTLVVAGSVGGVAAVGGLLWYFVLRRRKRRDDV